MCTITYGIIISYIIKLLILILSITLTNVHHVACTNDMQFRFHTLSYITLQA